MANSDLIFGARYAGSLSQGTVSGKTNSYVSLAAYNVAMFVGDFVVGQGTAAVDEYGIYRPVVQQAAAANRLLGFVDNFEKSRTYENQIHRTAATLRSMQVYDTPDVLFEIQSSGTFAVENVGLNANITVASGSTVTGLSGMELDQSTVNTTATLQLQIIGIIPRTDNAVGANTKLLCRINYHGYTKETDGF